MDHTLLTKVLLTWRLTNLLVSEEGPFDAFVHFRDAVGVQTDEFSQCVADNVAAKALCCFWCTSVWVGLSVAIGYRDGLGAGLVYSAGAILTERFFKGWQERQPTRY